VSGRRRFFVFALMATTVVLLAAAVAWAARTPYTGRVTPTGKVSFITKTSGGHLVVARFAFDLVPTHCSAGPRLQFFHFNSVTFRVSKMGLFHGHNRPGNPTTVVVAGEFNNKRSHATGTLRLTGSIGPHTGCHTGTLRWSARRS
jgi:hypothetical protein